MTDHNEQLDYENLYRTGLEMSQQLKILSGGQDNATLQMSVADEWSERHNQAFQNLVKLSELVPYEAIVLEHQRLGGEIGRCVVRELELKEKAAQENERLDALAKTVMAKQAVAVKAAALALAEKKKAEYQAEIDQELESNEAIKQTLCIEYQEFCEATSTIPEAWPIPPKTVSDKYVVVTNEASQNGSHSPEVVAELEGYAALAAQIPDLQPRLKGAVSEHIHLYEEETTVYHALEQISQKLPEERTEDETDLLRAIFILNKKFLQKPELKAYQRVYTPNELIELSHKLIKFSRKNRPDFDELEGRMLDMALVPLRFQGRRHKPADIMGARQRMHTNAEGRSGMTWGKMVNYSERACDTIRQYMMDNRGKTTNRQGYLLEIVDKSDKKPDLSWVYQFIADDHAYTMISGRRIESDEEAKEHFLENCGVIKQWLAEVDELLDDVPTDLRLIRHSARRKDRFTDQLEQFGAAYMIRGMIEDIIARRDGNETTGIRKKVDFGAKGALSHQLRLAKMVDQLKLQLAEYTEYGSEEIVPLD